MRTPAEDHLPPPATRLPTAWRVVPPLAVALLIVVVFVPALAAGFVGWDDDDLLLTETRYRTLNGNNLLWMFTTSYTGHFQPLTWLSYWLDARLWSLDPFGFHLTNVLLHAGCAMAFFFIVRRLVAAAGSPLTARHLQLAAALAAVLFATHPLRVESVAWIAERRDVLGAFFFLLSVACYLPYVDAANASELRSRARAAMWYGGVVLFCAVSLLAKATAVMLPLVLWVLDAYPLRRSSRPASLFGGRRSAWIDKLPLIALSVLAGIRALVAQHEQGAMVPLAEHGLLARMIQAGYGLAFYIWKTVAPANLGPLYELPTREILVRRYGWSYVVVLALVMTAIAARRRLPALTAALAIYVVLLVPVLGLAQSGPQLVADRYSYLSCMGFAAIAAVGLVRAGVWAGASRRASLRAMLVLSVAVVLTLMQHATARQCDVWRSGLTLWSHAVRVAPESAIAHANYADALAETGRFEPALTYYERSLELRPGDAITAHLFADVLRMTGDADGAIAMYLRTLQLDPARTEAHFNLADLLIAQGRMAHAETIIRERLRRVPHDRRAAAFLAELLAIRNRPLE